MKTNIIGFLRISYISKTFPELCKFSNMPKKSRILKQETTTTDKASSGPSSSSVNTNVNGPVVQTKDGHFSIAIQVKPGAKTNAVIDVSEDAISVQIAAPPVDGEANIAIVKYFAEILSLKKAQVSLKGGKSRQKTVTVDSSTGLSIPKILEVLKSQRN